MGSELVYGHWGLVLFYSLAWSIAIFALIRPRMFRELAVFARVALFLIAEFTEASTECRYPSIPSLAGLLFIHRLSFSHAVAGSFWRILFRQAETRRVEGSTRTISGAVC